jgi:hypothetical protein
VSHVYHLVADDFRGDKLLPLHMLATAYPDVHEREVQKWVGRESVLDFVVPHLGVTWSNTVNLAALDPSLLVEARRRLGLPFSRLLERRVLRIPVERIDGLAAVQYDSRSHWRNSRPGEDVPATPPESEFVPFDARSYQELTEVPRMHLDYLVERRDAELPALGFVFVRHVLVAGPIDVSGLHPEPVG